MNWFNWQPGRQGTGYQKLKIAQGKWWDCWLIYYRPGDGIGWHRDDVPDGKSHWRINIRLWGEDTFRAEPEYCHHPIYTFWRGVLFRPDLIPHRVEVSTKSRLMLSIGWIR